MLKHLRSVVCLVAISFVILSNSIAFAENKVSALEHITAEQARFIQDVKVNDLDIEPINTQEVKKDVIPNTKNEGKKVMAYFLRAMLGVVFCAIVLYLILIFVKKYYGSAFVNPDEEEYFEAFDLSTPKTKQDALKSFLNRTK